MLPFLKNKHEGSSSSSPDDSMSMGDEGEDSEFGMLDAIAGDLLEAFKKHDKKLIKYALEALMEHIQGQDQIQDEEYS